MDTPGRKPKARRTKKSLDKDGSILQRAKIERHPEGRPWQERYETTCPCQNNTPPRLEVAKASTLTNPGQDRASESLSREDTPGKPDNVNQNAQSDPRITYLRILHPLTHGYGGPHGRSKSLRIQVRRAGIPLGGTRLSKHQSAFPKKTNGTRSLQ